MISGFSGQGQAMNTTYSAKPGEVAQRWLLVDLNGQTLGRVASQIASALRGKTKPTYTPHVDTGDYVIAINVDKIVLRGSNKLTDKFYYNYSGYPGGMRKRSAAQMMATNPEDVLLLAVKGMLPKNRLGRDMLTKLKIYRGTQHPHGGQNPQPANFVS
jgi:large subunit ribosomal protein L13